MKRLFACTLLALAYAISLSSSKASLQNPPPRLKSRPQRRPALPMKPCPSVSSYL